MKPNPETGEGQAKRLMALDVRMPESATSQRQQLVLFLAELARLASTMAPQEVRHLTGQLYSLGWQCHRTDDVFTCLLCGAQDTHTERCPVRTLVTTPAAQRAMRRDPEFPDVETARVSR